MCGITLEEVECEVAKVEAGDYSSFDCSRVIVGSPMQKELQDMTPEELREHFGVTAEQLDAMAAEYESDDWSHMRFGEIIQGRPI